MDSTLNKTKRRNLNGKLLPILGSTLRKPELNVAIGEREVDLDLRLNGVSKSPSSPHFRQQIQYLIDAKKRNPQGVLEQLESILYNGGGQVSNITLGIANGL